MMRLVRFGVLLAASAAPLVAQPLYRPRAIQRAYDKQTRSPDGRPGPAYWQNHGRYTIDMTVTPAERAVRGSERITYVNESPDTLRSLNFKLLLNVHKPGAPRQGPASADYLTSGVHVDTVTVNGAAVRWGDDARAFTNKRLSLPAPLLPHDSVQLSIAWH